MNRRLFMRGAALAATMAATGLLYRKLNPPPIETPKGETLADFVKPNNRRSIRDGFRANEQANSLDEITNYNNFYEFSTAKALSRWNRRVLSLNPGPFRLKVWLTSRGRFDLNELLKFPPEERVYRLRCVEGWSMVIPWIGFPLAKLLEQVEPTAQASYVAFQTLFDPQRMPNQRTGVLDWPYVEGLRLDEAMHPLTILATGFTAKLCRRRTERQFAWLCHGNMDSRVLSPW